MRDGEEQNQTVMDMAASPQQSNMIDIPPPSYRDVMQDPGPAPAQLYNVEFGPEPLQLPCWSCHRQVEEFTICITFIDKVDLDFDCSSTVVQLVLLYVNCYCIFLKGYDNTYKENVLDAGSRPKTKVE